MNKNNIVIDEYVCFGGERVWDEEDTDLFNYFGCIESFENKFNIEFSCGDGKFLSDLKDDGELDYYDGKVCLKSAPRYNATKELLKVGKPYRFTITYNDNTKTDKCYINSKEMK